jgi:long-chain acyl-CoA synthetase
MVGETLERPVGSARDWEAFGLRVTRASREIPDAPQSVAEVLRRPLAERPDAEALVGRFARYSYRRLDEAVCAAVAVLQALGLKAGEAIAATTANHTELVVAFLAAQRLGAIWVGVNRNLAAPEKRFILEDCQAALYLAEHAACDQIAPLRDSLPTLRRMVRMEPGDAGCEWAALMHEHAGRRPVTDPVDPFAPAAIAYTSGTTGFPKGVVHSQHNIVLVGAMARLRGAGDLVFRAGVALPLTILNLMILGPVSAFQAGSTCVLMDRIDPLGLAEWIKAERVESFSAVPTMIHDLITHPDIDPEDLKTFTRPGVGAAAFPESFRKLYRERFGRELGTGYGLTEAPTSVTSVDLDKPIIPGSSGPAAPHLQVSIQDEEGRLLAPGESGEVCVAGADAGEYAGLYTPMLGYWRRPEATEAALRGGWLHTGDVGRMDEEGNLFIEGRRNDVILRGGANVYPAEIERVLHLDDRVSACAVVGRSDERLGEIAVAVIQPAKGVTDTDGLQAALQALCQENLARYKTPEAWLFVDDMPRNAMNKIVKAELKSRYFAS